MELVGREFAEFPLRRHRPAKLRQARAFISSRVHHHIVTAVHVSDREESRALKVLLCSGRSGEAFNQIIAVAVTQSALEQFAGGGVGKFFHENVGVGKLPFGKAL